jgi:serine/threonine protein kinase
MFNVLLITWACHPSCPSPYLPNSLTFKAPEYALDEQLTTASDMYALGCLIYAVHCKGNPPFSNHGSLSGLRDNAGKSVTGTEHLDADLRGQLHGILYPFIARRRADALGPFSPSLFTYHTTASRSSQPQHITNISVFLLSASLHPQLFGSIYFRVQDSRRKNSIHERPFWCSPKVFGWPPYSKDITITRRRSDLTLLVFVMWILMTIPDEGHASPALYPAQRFPYF